MKIIAIIVAGGSSSRFNSKKPKQYELLDGLTVLEKTISQFLKSSFVIDVIVVIRPEDVALYKQATDKLKILTHCFGGETRSDSVLQGLITAKKYNPDYVLIHDACRPFVSPQLIDKLIEELIAGETAVCPVIQVTETVKRVINGQAESVNRENLFLVQTPQCFLYNEIYRASLAKNSTIEYTDETSLFESIGELVKYVHGERENIKITRREDLVEKFEILTGSGFDAHRFTSEEYSDGFITLGGIKIPHTRKIIAHSDGDVLIHALVDALLGAIGAGDIGEHFPPSDNQWKNADSMLFLKFTLDLLNKKNASINNIDLTVICEKPRLSDYKNSIKNNIATATGLKEERINVKATTTEKMGFTGRGEGIAVMAMATIKLLSSSSNLDD